MSGAPGTVLLAAAVALSLGCPETRAQRGRDALELVVSMHRELCRSEIRQAKAFLARPEAGEASRLPLWPRCRVADADGLRIERDLLDHYLALRRGGRDEDLPERVRAYLAQREQRARAEVAALDQADRADPRSVDVVVRQGEREIYREEAAIVQAYRARVEALGR
jgi:hypothetical protein